MTYGKIIDNIARLNSETWRDREEVRTEIAKLLSELEKALEQLKVESCKNCSVKHELDVNLKKWADAYKRGVEDGKRKALEQPTSDDCVSREQARFALTGVNLSDMTAIELIALFDRRIKSLPPVTPTHGTCKDCKHWKDSDGEYRRGIYAESKCPINIKEVYEGNFYCKWFEKRGDENGGN